MNPPTDLLDSLNDAQHLAVTTASQHCLVLAGAGSGKTRVLVHRMAWLIRKQSIDPASIFAVTFTNKVAGEMKQRLSTWLTGNTHRLWVGTFHGLAHRLLRLHHQEADLDKDFQILDASDQLRLTKRVLKALNVDDKRYAPRDVVHFINTKKDEGLLPHQLGHLTDPYQRQMAHIYTAYQAECQRAHVIDFGEILLRVYTLWSKFPHLQAHYQQRFSHILVDEFQDTNTIQYAWFKLLVGAQSQVMIVGDDDQSIYGWRGAKVENIQRFTQDFANVQIIRLEQNYRSTACILEAANAVIAQNTMRLGKKLWTKSQYGEAIELYEAINEKDEASMVVHRIQHAQAQGKNLRDCAVLYRSNAQSRAIEEALNTMQIPYCIYGGVRFFEREEVKHALSYLRLMLNRDDNQAFERILNIPTRGIGIKTLDTLRRHAIEQEWSLWKATMQLCASGSLSPRASKAIQDFCQLINRLAQQLFDSHMSLSEQVEKVLDISGLLTFYQNDKQEKSQNRVENLKELISAVRVFEQNEQDVSEQEITTLALLTDFLGYTALYTVDTHESASSDMVQLMTLHAAKGLEFSCVFMVGVEDGLFPSYNSIQEPARLEEERRLCYVGMTRACEQLFITHAQCRRLYGREMFNQLSRFIKEIPDALIRPVRLQVKITPSMPTKIHDKPITNDLYAGLQVSHQMFGFGVIQATKGSGTTQQVLVDFQGRDTKWLMVQYANLQIV